MAVPRALHAKTSPISGWNFAQVKNLPDELFASTDLMDLDLTGNPVNWDQVYYSVAVALALAITHTTSPAQIEGPW